MDLPVSKGRASRAFAALLALTACTSVAHATNVLTATSPITLTCSTASGPGTAATVTVKPVTALSGSATIAVTFAGVSGGLVVTAPSVTTLSTTNQAVGLIYTVNIVAGCVGASTGAQTFHFNAGGTSDATVTANVTVSTSTSGLVPSPNPATITCVKSGSTYTPGAAQTVSVTSTAAGGTAFTVDNTVAPPASWLTITPLTGGTASSTAVPLSLVAASGCGGFAVGSTNTTTVHLVNAPAPDKLLTVNLQILSPSPLVATPNPATLSYTKGSGSPGHVDVAVTSTATPAPFFAVDTATLPIWLTVDATTGTTPKSLRFSSTTVCDTLAPGTYSASVGLKVSGYGALTVPVSLLITNSAPRLSVAEGTTRNISWTVGQPLPTPFITAVSTDSPIPYSITTGGTLAPIVAAFEQKGLAYSFGTQIPVTFNPLQFAAAQPGSVLTGTVTLTWGTPASTIVVTFNITIQAPGATLTGLTPASLPTSNPGQTFTVVLTGTGFVTSTDPTQKTKVGIVVGSAIVADTNIATNVVNPSNIILTITVPASADALLPFSPSGAGGSVVLGICNPSGGTCSTPTATATLSIGSNPIIQSVTSASAFVQVSAPALQNIAPYDMLSIFGSNFCSSGGSGCSSNQILAGTPDPISLRYPTSVTPDAAGPTQRSLSVTFQTHGSSPTAIGTGSLLFATNGQINVLVPAAVTAAIGSSVDIVVNFGYGTGSTMRSSPPFTVNVVATNPGIYTIGADGQGESAALGSNYAVINDVNPAGMRSTASDSDTIQLYVTGLGAPDSTADNGSAGSAGTWSSDCVSTSTFLSSLNAATGLALTSLDGTLIQTLLLNTNRLVPCIVSSSADVPSVTIGGVAGTVVYAGWVADSIAGLYQVNVTLPGSTAGPFTPVTGPAISSIASPVQLPVVVTANGRSSQSGVAVWVTPRLLVSPPSGAGLSGTVGVPWSSSSNSVVASEGTSPYRYALTSGLLPAGLSLNGGTGAITGTPAANSAGSYVVTVTATDSAHVPVTGTATFTLTVAGGLFMTTSGTPPYNGTFGTANASLATTTATGGVYPYGYAITAPSTIPVGMTVGASSGVVGVTALTPAGSYNVTITATDSTGGTPLTGSISYSVVMALRMSHTAPASQVHGTPGTFSTVTATGNTGTIAYALDAASLAAGMTIDSVTGAVGSGTAAAGTYSVTVTATDGTAAPGAAVAGAGTTTFSVTVT